MERRVEVYDTTLRDGSQMNGLSFSVDDKIAVIFILDGLGVDFIEAGWPGSNPTDEEVFRRAAEIKLKHAIVTGFSMTCRKGVSPEKDESLLKLSGSKVKIATLVGKSSVGQVADVLRCSTTENLRMIKESCAFLKSKDIRIFYDAEHFFDGFSEHSSYALRTLQAAVNGGAERVILCDTNGGSFPEKIREVASFVKKNIDVPLGIHCHNDCGLAVANSLSAINEGIAQVQGTINGYGERCGNADLCVIIPNLAIKMGLNCLLPGQVSKITDVSRAVAEIANVMPDPNKPFVGMNAFTHKGGMHASAMARLSTSYQHIDPAAVGNNSRVTVSQLSGQGNIQTRAKEFGIELTSDQVALALKKVKEMENIGYQFEGADASIELLIRRAKGDYKKPFDKLNFTVVMDNRRLTIASEAVVRIKPAGETNDCLEASEGDGPVNALDLALRKALQKHYPLLGYVKLTDYKVRILNGDNGSAAIVRVLIEFDFKGEKWVTVGCSTNIVEGSYNALIDGFEYAILKFK